MKLRSTLARVVAVALVATSGAVASTAVTAPAAHAAGKTLATTATLSAPTYGLNDFGALEYGKTVSINGAVKSSEGSSVSKGTVTLEASPYPYTSWTPVQTTTASGFLSFKDLAPTISTKYRLTYSGYTAANQYEDTFQATVGPELLIPVARTAKIKPKGHVLKGKVAPDFAKQKLVFQKKKGKKYVKWFTVKTNKLGAFRKFVPGKVGDEFAIVWPSSNGYAGGVSFYHFVISF